jgi:alpha-amylase/alpha-mannosidase (GH57 family)
MTKLALLWHMHQPYYEDLATGEHILPWVRLHAIKDYWGMVAVLREFPQVRVTFNLVPSLLAQIQAFAADQADDRHLVIGLKPAESLDAEERGFLVANGFHASYERMIRPHARYAELHARRERPGDFTIGDLRDLQVLHKLVWMDPDWLASDWRLRALTDKRRGYSEDDKRQLREVELELLNAVIPTYREAAAQGRVELSTSPFYHPILPLLCDTDVHLRAHPLSALPRGLFAHPADARDQLARAFDYHARVFGAAPRGVWPSEGSVSDEVVALLAQAGAEWTATDEAILARSLGRALEPRRPLSTLRARLGATHGAGAVSRPSALGPDWFFLSILGGRCRGGGFRGEGPRGGAALHGSQRLGRRRGVGDPRWRERVGALPGRRPAVSPSLVSETSAMPRTSRR